MSYSKTQILFILLLMSATELFSQSEKRVEEALGLLVGETAPLFEAIDGDSNLFSLEKELAKRPVVLIFYRGFWCPVCNQHLSQLQDSLKLIEETGAKVIAISPEKPDYLEEMADKTGAEFSLLYDEDYRIAKTYDVNFKPTSKQLITYNVILGARLKKTHSDESQQLPIPATYIIGQNGKIIWRQFDPDYKNRSSVKEIVNAINKHFNSE